MKIQCNRQQLQKAFSTAAPICPQRSPKTILRNVKLSVTSDIAVLTATDMEIGVSISVEGVESEKSGEVLLPVGRFGMILKEASDDSVIIETKETETVIKCGRSRFKLSCENPAEFPEVQTFDKDSYHVVSAGLFKEMVRRTLFATETESSRFALSGVLLELEPDKLIAVSTDGRRLAKMEGPAKSVGGHSAEMTIVPSRAMQLIDRALSGTSSDIDLHITENEILVRSDSVTIYARLVEGRFPRWREVIPERKDAETIDFSVGSFYSALRQASIVSSDESRGVDFTFDDGLLVLGGVTAEIGQSRVELPISYNGSPVTLTMDHRYVADILRVLDDDSSVSVEIKDSESAAVFRTEDGYLCLVMPLDRG